MNGRRPLQNNWPQNPLEPELNKLLMVYEGLFQRQQPSITSVFEYLLPAFFYFYQCYEGASCLYMFELVWHEISFVHHSRGYLD